MEINFAMFCLEHHVVSQKIFSNNKKKVLCNKKFVIKNKIERGFVSNRDLFISQEFEQRQ